MRDAPQDAYAHHRWSVAALLFTVNIVVKFAVVQSGYGKLDAEIKEIYRQTFPDGKPSADPVRQMRDKMNEAKKLFGALAPERRRWM